MSLGILDDAAVDSGALRAPPVPEIESLLPREDVACGLLVRGKPPLLVKSARWALEAERRDWPA